MRELRAYLLRVVACGLLVSLAGTLPLSKRIRQAVVLCGGCLMMLTALGPILRADLTQLPQFLAELSGSDPEGLEQAAEKNDALLKEMIESQAAEQITEQAQSLGADLQISVEAKKDPTSGLYLPWAVTLTGPVAPTQRSALEAYLQSLDIPPQRQSWKSSGPD